MKEKIIKKITRRESQFGSSPRDQSSSKNWYSKFSKDDLKYVSNA
jgi:hypothetical protein